MSEGLENFKELKDYAIITGRYTNHLDAIEKELKEYEYWSKFVKCYGDVKTEDLRRFIHNGWVYDQSGYKKDKALEIIKEKKVQVATLLLSNTCVGYNFARGLLGEDLTQEEYDLLKEVLS